MKMRERDERRTVIGKAAQWAWLLAAASIVGGCLDASAGQADSGVGDTTSPADATDVAADLDAVDASDAAPDADVATEVVEPDRDVVTPPPEGIAAIGRFYRDPDGRAQSGWMQWPRPEAEGVAGVEAVLLTPGAASRSATTAGDGRVVFDRLAEGRHMLVVADGSDDTCTSNNMPRRFADAMLEGEVTVVTFGDSVPHWGPTPWFPARLEALLDAFVVAENVNIAVPGSTSADWLPGGEHFGRLIQEVEGADLAVFSLGGNDVTFYLSDFVEVDPSELLENIDYYLGLLDAKIAEIADNLNAIIASVRAVNPDIDIVWFIYPNYAWNDYWAPYLGDWAPFVRPLLDERLDMIRLLMSRSDILLADMHAAIPGEEVAGLMVDELHLNAAGHARYAEELFLLLGGITVGADTRSSRGLNRSYGFQ